MPDLNSLPMPDNQTAQIDNKGTTNSPGLLGPANPPQPSVIPPARVRLPSPEKPGEQPPSAEGANSTLPQPKPGEMPEPKNPQPMNSGPNPANLNRAPLTLDSPAAVGINALPGNPVGQPGGTSGWFSLLHLREVAAQPPDQVSQLDPGKASPPAWPADLPQVGVGSKAVANDALKQTQPVTAAPEAASSVTKPASPDAVRPPQPAPADVLPIPKSPPPVASPVTANPQGLEPVASPPDHLKPPAPTLAPHDAANSAVKPAPPDAAKPPSPSPAAGGQVVPPDQQPPNMGLTSPPTAGGSGDGGPVGLSPSAPKGIEPAPVPGAPPVKPVQPAEVVPAVPVTQTGAQERASAGGAGNVVSPPVGAVPSVTSPSVQVPAPVEKPRLPVSSGATVMVYETKSYICNPEDTTFEALSEHLYGSPDYAQALLRYNREHPRGDPGLQGASRPQPGMTIQVPPKDILKDRYRDASPDRQRTPAPPPGGADSVRQSSPITQSDPQRDVVAVTRPAGQTPVPVPSVPAPASGQANTAPATGVASGGKVYRVAAGGEPMWTIAQRALGNGSRWHEIYRLNPQLNPERPIPEGTAIVLPDNARGVP
jgi:hypothetical protein